MVTRVAINGFGRIGRSVFRLLRQKDDFQVVAINDISDAGTRAHLLKYDSVRGVYKGEVRAEGENMLVDGEKTTLYAEKDPSALQWAGLGVDLVLESTGMFSTREQCERHLYAGAKKVLLCSAPRGKVDACIVMGVNEGTLKPTDLIVSSMSSVTNAMAPPIKVLNESFGIKRGFMTALYASSGDQVVLDRPHNDLRKARAAAVSIIPTSIGALGSLGSILPECNGKLTGTAFRVPVRVGSMLDLVMELDKMATTEDINRTVKEAAKNSQAGIIEYCEDEIVSVDVAGNPASCIFDSKCTLSIGNNLVQAVAWFDNEWGYANRCVDILKKMAE